MGSAFEGCGSASKKSLPTGGWAEPLMQTTPSNTMEYSQADHPQEGRQPQEGRPPPKQMVNAQSVPILRKCDLVYSAKTKKLMGTNDLWIKFPHA